MKTLKDLLAIGTILPALLASGAGAGTASAGEGTSVGIAEGTFRVAQAAKPEDDPLKRPPASGGAQRPAAPPPPARVEPPRPPAAPHVAPPPAPSRPPASAPVMREAPPAPRPAAPVQREAPPPRPAAPPAPTHVAPPPVHVAPPPAHVAPTAPAAPKIERPAAPTAPSVAPQGQAPAVRPAAPPPPPPSGQAPVVRPPAPSGQAPVVRPPAPPAAAAPAPAPASPFEAPTPGGSRPPATSSAPPPVPPPAVRPATGAPAAGPGVHPVPPQGGAPGAGPGRPPMPGTGPGVAPVPPTGQPPQVQPVPPQPGAQFQPGRPGDPGRPPHAEGPRGPGVGGVLGAAAAGAAVGVVGGVLLGSGGQAQGLDDVRRQRREVDRDGATFYSEPDGRVIVRDRGGLFLRHDETARFRDFGGESTVERRGDETVSVWRRPDGVRIVTVTDADGRLIRRIREWPDGRREVLIDDGFRPRGPGFREEIVVLPPPPVPRERWVIESDRADERLIEETLEAPPLGPLPRRYTLDEVRSSRDLRAYMPAIDVDTITFPTGAWTVEPEEIGRLARIARGITRALARNPDEIFLVEGHTDLVGNDVDNLSLSDRRAQAVAAVLSRDFSIPAENLVTQGYGAQFPKEMTDGPSQINRRVTVRRITPLIGADAGR